MVLRRAFYWAETRSSKKSVRRVPKKKIYDNAKKYTVNGHLEYRMQSAQGDVEGEPHDQQPAGPIPAAEHKNSADDRQHSDQANPDQLVLK